MFLFNCQDEFRHGADLLIPYDPIDNFYGAEEYAVFYMFGRIGTLKKIDFTIIQCENC
jgi:hypothetical protein